MSHSRSASVSSWDAKDDGVLLRDDDGQASVCSKFRLRSWRVLDTRARSFSYSSAARRSTFLYLRQRGIGHARRHRSCCCVSCLPLLDNHACNRTGTERRWRGKDDESRTDEESWNSGTESEKTCSRGLVQHASFRPLLLLSTSPFSFPALPNLNSQLEPTRTESCGTESTFSLSLFL